MGNFQIIKHTWSKATLAGALLSVLISSCDGPGGGPNEVNFDQEAMLSHVGQNIILPAYQTFSSDVSALAASLQAFETEPSQANLEAMQSAHLLAWESYQAVSPFNFGPADANGLSNYNIYPTDVQQIESNIGATSYDLNTAENIDAQGFPAIDYLLHSEDTQEATLQALSNEARLGYLKDVVAALNLATSATAEAWSATGGNYVEQFATNTGTDVGSSLGMLVNTFNQDFELLKNGQLGIPLGKRTLGEALPDRVEAYYSGISASLAQAHLEAIHELYRGIGADGTNGPSLEDYLEAINPIFDGETPLVEAIATQMQETTTALAALPDPLSETILSQPSLVEAAWDEVQAQVILFKTDMPSALGVLITYQDNDGD